MGFENRSYFRDGSYTNSLGGWGVDFTPVVKWLIIANVVVFVLQIFLTHENKAPKPSTELTSEWQQKQFEITEARREVLNAKKALKAAKEGTAAQEKEKEVLAQKEKELKELEQEVQDAAKEMQREMVERMTGGFGGERVSVVQEWGELSPNKTVKEGQVWRLLTCAFLHDRYGIWHIVFNMLLLYWFGTRLERMYGSREFLLFYLAAALSSSVAYVALALYTGSNTPAIGASGAVMGVMMLYVIFYPFERFMLFWFIPVPLCVLLGFYVLFDLHPVLLALAGDKVFTGVANAGHLGGLLFGFLYWKFHLRLESVFGRTWKGARLMRRSKPEPFREPVVLPMTERDALANRVDEVLKKISEHGKESLTDEERDILIQASSKYRGKE
jgi:membrane associated rhomboid family serine protease